MCQLEKTALLCLIYLFLLSLVPAREIHLGMITKVYPPPGRDGARAGKSSPPEDGMDLHLAVGNGLELMAVQTLASLEKGLENSPGRIVAWRLYSCGTVTC